VPGIAEHQDRAADAAPARVMDVVAEIAAALGAVRGLRQRRLAEPLEKVGGAVIGFPIDDENDLLQHAPSNPPDRRRASAQAVKPRRRDKVNCADTIGRRDAGRLARVPRSCKGGRMTDRDGPKAGGFLLAMSILGGALIGTLEGEPSVGVIAGTGVGVAIALALWWTDRARGPR
jgi:hypothetical protein